MKQNLIGKIRYILNRKQKISLIFLFFGILISSFLELISISSILPIVNMLTQQSPEQSWYVDLIQKIFHTSGNSTIVVISIIMMIIYLFKSGFVIFINYMMNSFMRKFQINLSTRLIRTYLYMPYEFHLQNNSASLLRSATTDVANFNSMMTSFLQILLKVVVSLSILIYLFINDAIITSIVTGILGIVLFIITFIFKPKIRNIGKEINRLNAINIKSINQAFNGIKESKIADAEEYFAECYKKNQAEINELTLKNTLYNEIPTTTLESFGMIALLSALLVVMQLGVEKTKIVSTFTLFALSTIKLLPCLSNISSHFNTLFLTKTSVDLIYNDIKKAELNKDVIKNSFMNYSHLGFNNELAAKNVTFRYSGSNINVLNNISAVVKKGEFVAFTGVSGAGKTTFIDLLLGLLKPTSGSIYCDSTDISNNPRGWHENLSYIPQMIYLMDDTVRNNVAFGIYTENVDDNEVWEALEKAQLANFIKSLQNGLDTIIGERGVRLSGGQRQRIGIARALYRNTQVLIFDEATSALDYDTEAAIINCVKGLKREHTIIMITHRLNTIESCDHIYEIAKGNMTLKR